ncbi:MAG: FecR domain-containing protein [Chitinophagaceae bacterium]
MSATPDRLEHLLNSYAEKQATEVEMQELLSMLQDDWQRIQLIRNEPEVDWEKMYREIKQAAGIVPNEKARVIKINFRRIAIAASIILAVGISAYFFISTRNEEKSPPIATTTHDVEAPKNTRATITLADGRIIELDSLTSGKLATQGNVNVTKTADGEIIYNESSKAPSPLERAGGEVSFNTLTNPRGSKVIDMTLSDGSHVWLNAGSSITYPIAFLNKERKVTITGEAYFEVAHLNPGPSPRVEKRGAATPFIVKKGDMEVVVLGTHFNVNAYDDEDALRVTLLEGSVKVSQQEQAIIIKPGEQAESIHNSKFIIHNSIDMEQVMAWRNGKFDFGESTNLKDIMRQVARWYDVEIAYSSAVNQQFWGSVSRQENVSKVLEKFELTGRVHFKIEGRKITVMP